MYTCLPVFISGSIREYNVRGKMDKFVKGEKKRNERGRRGKNSEQLEPEECHYM